MKKSYIKPTVFVEHLAMKSSISTCGFVSTKRIEDNYTCDKQFYNPTQEGGWCEKHKGLGPSVPTYVPDFGYTLVCSENRTCRICYECYHVPGPGELDGENEAYVGIS